MTRFRPCIDLHAGSVKQIVGGTLTTTDSDLKTNYVSEHPSKYYAELYKKHDLLGAHVIMLGPNNDDAAKEACQAWPNKLQVGGGVNDKNAQQWIEWGAEKVIITSYLFPEGKFSLDRLKAVSSTLGNDTSKLVIDLSCRRKGDTWFVAMNKWQTLTDMELNQGTTQSLFFHRLSSRLHCNINDSSTKRLSIAESISLLEPHCCEFLIHAADNEGLQKGIDHELVSSLSKWCSIPVTYAGGGRNLADLDLVEELSDGKVDLTIGSALDVFGGKGCKFDECVEWNRRRI